MFLSFLLLLLVFYLRLMIAQVMCVRWNVFFEACFIDRVKEWCSFLKGRNTRSVALRKKKRNHLAKLSYRYNIQIVSYSQLIHSSTMNSVISFAPWLWRFYRPTKKKLWKTDGRATEKEQKMKKKEKHKKKTRKLKHSKEYNICIL